MRSAPVLLVLCVACDRSGHADVGSQAAHPTRALVPVPTDQLCVTSGELREARVEASTFRAVAADHAGDAASLTFRARGTTSEQRALDSGEMREQIGLKLRAQDGCNLIYVMWREAPRPGVEVSVKRNPDAHTSKECGAHGYKNVKPPRRIAPPALTPDVPHELRAEITGDSLTAWIDGTVAWKGTLPAAARDLAGPAGIRSDNLAFDVVELAVDATAPATPTRSPCAPQTTD